MPEDKVFEFTFGLLKVKINYKPDSVSTNDLCWLGEYSNKWRPGAIDRFEGDPHRSRDQYRYFHPAFSPNSINDLHKELHKSGYSRHEAYTIAHSVAYIEYRRMESFLDGNADLLGLVATVYYQNKELESSSVWGIESDSDESYLIDEEYNEAIEALQWVISEQVYTPQVKHLAEMAQAELKNRLAAHERTSKMRHHIEKALPGTGYAAWYDKQFGTTTPIRANVLFYIKGDKVDPKTFYTSIAQYKQ